MTDDKVVDLKKTSVLGIRPRASGMLGQHLVWGYVPGPTSIFKVRLKMFIRITERADSFLCGDFLYPSLK